MAKARNELGQDRNRLSSSWDLTARLVSTDEVAGLLAVVKTKQPIADFA